MRLIGSIKDRRLRHLAAMAAFMVALTLILVKSVAFIFTNSVSILSSLIDSCLDLITTLLVFFGVHRAQRPPDPAHRFGWGKTEPLVAVVQAAFIGGSAILLALQSIKHLFRDNVLVHEAEGVAVMLFAMALTAGLVTFQRYVVKKTGSMAIAADRLHYTGDVLMNAGVIGALILTRMTGMSLFDTLFGLMVAAYMLINAWRVADMAFGALLDRELDDAARARIEKIVLNHQGARGMHDLRTRNSGTQAFIELHLELDGDLSLRRAHDITDRIEDKLRMAFADAEVTIHQEPAGLDDERLDDLIRESNER